MSAPGREGRHQARAAALRSMQRLALALLVGVAALYVAATALEPRHLAWGYVAAFAEAAMVGALADWFAVVALFRHPLGLPIPHTAIIPRNQRRIGDNLASFICDHFLGTPQVLEKVRTFDPAGRLAAWLARPDKAEMVGSLMVRAMAWGIGTLDDARVREFVRATAVARLEQVDFSLLGGRLLDVLTADRRHQALLDSVLAQIEASLADEALQARIAATISAELDILRFRFFGKEVGLDGLAGRWSTEKIVRRLSGVVGEMGADPAHPLRQRFDEQVAEFIRKLREDPAFRLKGEQIRAEVLARPELAQYLSSLWSDLLVWLRTDLAAEDSGIRRRVRAAASTLGERLARDTAMRAWINEQVLAAAPEWIDRYREDIRRYIAGRVHAWSTDELSRELELNIGRDLQFIRINGTLVGGCVGLVIHALTRWLA